MQKHEVEMRFKCPDLEDFKSNLIKMGAKLSGPEIQEDFYFRPKGKENAEQKPGDFILRIRRTKDKKFLTLKGLTEIRGAWLEHELEINNAEEAEKMLSVMGYARWLEISKTRQTTKLDDFEICIDDVKQLGPYVEVSLFAEDTENARNKIKQFISNLGISENEFESRGYPEIIGEILGIKFSGMR